MRYRASKTNAALRLREAAYRFAGLDYPEDSIDRAGIAAHRNLLACAIRYATVESQARIDRTRLSTLKNGGAK